MWHAWHVVRLGHFNPKKFPALDKLMVKGARAAARRPRQSPEQMLAICQMMAGMSFPEHGRKVN